MYEVQRVPRGPLHVPATDAVEKPWGLELSIDLPGVTSQTLDLSIEGQVLKIHGRVANRYPKGMRVLHEEAPAGDFVRALILTDEFDTSAIEASLDDGVLTLRIPKRVPRKVEVRAN